MLFSELITTISRRARWVVPASGGPDVEVRGVTRDSREVGRGIVFVAVRGERVDGHDWVAGLPSGAAALVERDVAPPPGVAWARVPDAREALGWAAAALEGDPVRRVPVIGVTGTNGKTTVTTLIQQAVQATGGVAGRIGTTGVEVGATVIPSSLTTPEAPVLHAWFRQMIEADASLIAMEVSSIGLVQRRVVGIPFALGVFTNLTHDHLDFHGTFEAYAAAKALLFQEGLREIGGAPRALLCADDAGWPRMDPPADRWLYGFHPSADVRVEDVALGVDGTSLTLRHPLGAHRITSPLVGRHNAQNLAAAWAAGVLVGVDADQMAAGLAHATGAPGRLERVADPGGRLVLVDYAHTPDALETVLRSVRASLTPPGRLFVVFGCGGDRDRAKRPEMGRVSLAADVVVLTSDNPRSEDPLAILAEVEVGARPCPASVTLRVEPDRGAAIAWALAEASPGDAVLIAGKGHEPYQEIGGVRHPFSDRGCVEAWIAARAALGGDR